MKSEIKEFTVKYSRTKSIKANDEFYSATVGGERTFIFDDGKDLRIESEDRYDELKDFIDTEIEAIKL